VGLSKDLCGILAAGVEKERKAHEIYVAAAEKTSHPLGKKMFRRLAEEETKHEQLLASWASQGVCPAVSGPAPADKDWLARQLAKVAAAEKPNAGDLEAIELGRQMELKSIQFYTDCAAKAPDPPSKGLFLRLKGEEDKHLAMLTDLYEFMANPGVWQTREGRAHFDS